MASMFPSWDLDFVRERGGRSIAQLSAATRCGPKISAKATAATEGAAISAARAKLNDNHDVVVAECVRRGGHRHR